MHLSIVSLPLTVLLVSLWAAGVLGQSTQWTFDEIPSLTNLTWYPCYTGHFCSRLDVPLDYTKSDGLRSSIPLIKSPAWTNITYKGMVLINPGGPGVPGLDFLIQNGDYLSNVIGRNYDLVSWDPRGVGDSIPAADCSSGSTLSNTTALRLRRRAPTVPRIKLAQLNSSYVESVLVEAKAEGLLCNETIGGEDGAGMHMSTADVARDMISILDAYAKSNDGERAKDPNLLNYWGFSYGTFLGETFASMFPDRVGRVALDGVLDPEDYVSGLMHSNLNFMDDVYATFFVYCNAAGIERCPIYTGTTPLDIYNRVESSFLQFNSSYAFSQNWANATLLDEGLAFIRTVLSLAVYYPITYYPLIPSAVLDMERVLINLTEESIQNWQNDFFQNLEIILTNNFTEIPTVIDIPQFANEFTVDEIAIWASDDGGASYGKTLAELEPWIEGLEDQSVIGGFTFASIRIWKSVWPIFGLHRYAGPFGGKTKNPILFVSNTLDPVTPITNSQKWAPAYSNSQILTTEGTGHSSLASLNSCTNTKIKAYFQDGTLPGSDNFCPLEEGPFGVVLSGGLEKRTDYIDIRDRMKRLLKF